MKNYQADSIRNIAVLGHGGEGKTTLTEAMLFNAGLLDRMGKVDDGTTVSDYDPEETKRHISISAAVAPFEWNGTLLTLPVSLISMAKYTKQWLLLIPQLSFAAQFPVPLSAPKKQ